MVKIQLISYPRREVEKLVVVMKFGLDGAQTLCTTILFLLRNNGHYLKS